jgi:Domain of unknown function (DUF4838)/Glycosyl hydrolase family 67 N-terminus
MINNCHNEEHLLPVSINYIATIFLVVFLTSFLQSNAMETQLYPPAVIDYSIKIVIPVSPSSVEIKASRELKSYLFRITNVTYPILKDSLTDSSNCIFIGKTSFALRYGFADTTKKLKRDGFVIRTINNSLVILGENDLGTLYGVYEYLEHLGVRWFMPGNLGEVIPKMSRISFIRKLNLTEQPSFEIRDIGTGGYWSLHNKMNVNIKGIRKFGISIWGLFATFRKILPASKYFDAHPDWYPLINGVRRKYDPTLGLVRGLTQGNQISLVNSWPKVAQIMDSILTNNENLDEIELAPNDGDLYQDGFSEEPKEQAWDDTGNVAQDQRYSRRLLIFYNKVATLIKLKHPKVIVRIGAYSDYTEPPKDTKVLPLDNMHVFVTHSGYSESKPLNEVSGPNKDFVKILLQWRKRFKNKWAIEVYEYYDKENWFGLPWPLYRKISIDIPTYQRLGVVGLYTQYSEANSWALLLNYYIAAKYLWNTNLDVDSLLDDFYNRFYQSAEQPMKDYYETLYKAFVSSGKDFDGGATNAVSLFTPLVISKCRKYIREAKKLAGIEQPVLKRISLAEAGINYTEKVVDFLNLKEKAENYKGNSLDKDRLLFNNADSSGRALEAYMLNNDSLLSSGVVNVPDQLEVRDVTLGGAISKIEKETKKVNLSKK